MIIINVLITASQWLAKKSWQKANKNIDHLKHTTIKYKFNRTLNVCFDTVRAQYEVHMMSNCHTFSWCHVYIVNV